MANLKDVIYLSNSDYATLVSTGTVTINGTTLTYDDSNVYITPEEGENFNVINASDIVSNTLTQAQYDLITNGKPTLIKGTLLSIKDLFIISINGDGTYKYATCIGGSGYQNNSQEYTQLKISSSNFGISIATNDPRNSISQLYSVNGKSIPAYPSSPANAQVLTYGTNNTLSWTGKLTLYRHRVSFNATSISGALIVDFYVTYATPITSISDVYQLFCDALIVKDSSGDAKYTGIDDTQNRLLYIGTLGIAAFVQYDTFDSDTVTEL